jgi:hypothetical protein
MRAAKSGQRSDAGHRKLTSNGDIRFGVIYGQANRPGALKKSPAGGLVAVPLKTIVKIRF